MAIPIFRPTIRRQEMNRVLDCMVSDRIGPGKLSVELSKLLAVMTSNRGGIALASYYSGIVLAFRSLDLHEGDVVIVPALAPKVYIEAAKNYGLNVVVADVDANTGVITENNVERHLSRNPKLVVVHYPFGVLRRIDGIKDLGIPIMEDISHAIGGSVEGKAVGSYGDMVLLSLDAENKLTAALGCVVLTKNTSILKRIKHLGESSAFQLLPDMNAAVALAQLKDFEAHEKIRKKIAGFYREAVIKGRHKTFFFDDEECYVDYNSFPIVVENGTLEVKRYAKKNNVEVVEAFSSSVISEYGELADELPNATALFMRTLIFPLYAMLGKGDVELVSRVISTLP